MNKLYDKITFENGTTPALNEDNLNAMSEAIDGLDDRVVQWSDEVFEIVPLIQAYLDQADNLVDALENMMQTPPQIGANGNWWVWDTTTRTYVDSGIDASISVQIEGVTSLQPDAQPYVINYGGSNTDLRLEFFIPRGQTGATGNGISYIYKSSTSGDTDTYTIVYTDGRLFDYQVTNGAGADKMSKVNPTGSGAVSINRYYDEDYPDRNVIGNNSVTLGDNCAATSANDFAAGELSEATGRNSFAMGEAPTASGSASAAIGWGSTASGSAAFAIGHFTEASGIMSFASGEETTASGDHSFTTGEGTEAAGENAHAEGYFTLASSDNQHVFGKYNIEDTNGAYVRITGNGTSSTRANIETLDWEGNLKVAGDIEDGAGHKLSDAGVSSFNGRSGSILPIAGDYTAETVTYDANTTVKTKIDTKLQGKLFGTTTTSNGTTVSFSGIDATKAYMLMADYASGYNGALVGISNTQINGTTITYTVTNATVNQTFALFELN